jgi:hypothetical protein
LAGTHAFVSESAGLYRIDASDKAAPVVAQIHACDGGVDLASKGQIVYAASWNFAIYDFTDPANPIQLRKFGIPGTRCEKLTVLGDYAYLACGTDGLKIIDISTPATASVIRTVDTPGNAVDIRVSGNFAYIADEGQGLAIIDIALPASASLTKSFPITGSATSLEIAGDTVYLGNPGTPLTIVDVSDRASPRILKSLSDYVYIYSFSIIGDTLYVGDVFYLKILDITDRSNPVLKKSINTGYFINDILAYPGYCYLANGQMGFTIYGTP